MPKRKPSLWEKGYIPVPATVTMGSPGTPAKKAFWPIVVDIYKKMGGDIKKGESQNVDKSIGEMPAVQPDGLSPDERAVVDVINSNPDANASAFYNTLKAKGFTIAGPKHEADSASSTAPLLRAGVKESARVSRRGNIADNFTSFKFLEALKSDSLTSPSKFKVALIQEGMGNLKDAFYYTRPALESAVPVFEGKKCYADHPSAFEEENRPERSVRDVIGHFENVHIEENEDGRAMLCADLVVMPEEPYKWAQSLMSHAVKFSEKYKDKTFIGLSINASGDANPVKIADFLQEGNVPSGAKLKLEKAMSEGINEVRLVTAIKDAVSADLVTEPGASGTLLDLLEGEKMLDPKSDKIAVSAEADGAPADHADEQQDKELIKKMIKKHLGDEDSDKGDDKDSDEGEEEGEKHAESEEAEESEAMKHAHEAYEYFSKERKMEAEEAAKHAAEAVKCAMHLAKKHSEAAKHDEAEEGEEAKKHESEEGEEAKKHSEKKKESEEDEKKKESELARLAGRVAFLEGEIKTRDLEKTIEARLASSKLPRSATKAFKESVGKVKSADEFEKLFSLFEKAYHAGGEGSHGVLDLSIEKTTRLTESTEGKATVGFGDCVKK